MIFSEYLAKQDTAMQSIPVEQVEGFLAALQQLRDDNKFLWVAGNGGSASTASHFVGDLVKTVKGHGSKSLKTVALSEMTALQTAYANDESFESAMGASLLDLSNPGDGLLIISVSGLSPNLIAAASAARERGVKIFSLVGQRGQALAEESDYAILVESNDYQIVENAHVILMHWFAKAL
jgi:D-sedoheptulose 7-phosphate isomerase